MIPTSPEYPLDADAFQRALELAARHHAGQVRKRTHVPYLTHPVIVAETLAYFYPGNTALVVAGLLHDTVEDTSATVAEVAEAFGTEVAALVEHVTKPASVEGEDDPQAAWRVKRRAMLDALAGAPTDAYRLKAADALANLQAIARDRRHPEVGEGVWERFKVGRDESLWYYREILARVAAELGEEPIVAELERALAEVEG